MASDGLPILTGDIVGELAGKMAEADGVPFAVALSALPTGEVIYHLRSLGGFDVGELARRFGGGGDEEKASFLVRSPFALEPGP